MSYLVLARKWRPTRFDDVVGQRHVTQTLQNAIRHERVPHALLFIGSRGVGKTSCARIFAKALNCLSESKPVPTPCDTCPSCESVNQGASVDVYEIDGASNNGVEQVRELRESTQFKPSLSRFKIYIIDEVHMLSVGAFNALLKTLEEPPPHVKFIFATTEPHKIPDTIISRCQRFDFKRISSRDIVDALAKICVAEGVNAERPALEHVAREAQGGMRDSLSLLDQLISFCGVEITEPKAREILGLTSREMLLELLGALYRQDAARVISLIHEHAESGADLKRLAAELLELLRDLMVMKVHPAPQQVLELPPSELELMGAYVEPMQVGAIHHTFQTLAQRADEIQRSAHPKLLLEMALLQMCHQADSAMLSEVMGGLLQLESHLNEIGLKEGLPPLAPPPTYRPPYTSPRAHPLPAPQQQAPQQQAQQQQAQQQQAQQQPAQQPAQQHSPAIPSGDPTGESRGIDSAQPKATMAAPVPAPLGRPSSAERAPMQTPPEQGDIESFIPPPGGRSRHPPLPSDPNQPPRFAEEIDASIYEWMILFNQWLAQRDSFFASEMRLKSRVLMLSRNQERGKLTLGGPAEMWATLSQHLDEVIPQLIKSAGDAQINLPHNQLELELVELTDDDPRWSIASLRDYLKHKLTLRALSEVNEATTSEYVSQHLKALGGQVIYVIPQALHTQV